MGSSSIIEPLGGFLKGEIDDGPEEEPLFFISVLS